VSSPEWVTIGKIVGVHGVKGEVKIVPSVDDPAFWRSLKSLYLEGRQRRVIQVQSVRMHQGNALVTFEGMADRTAAETLRGRDVAVPFAWLPVLEDDEYYVAQLIGLTVVTTAGETLGTIKDVMFTGANEVYVIRGDRYGEVLIPAIASVVQTVDIPNRTMTIELPEGLVGNPKEVE
jgi:16S rRNA processing protein RimM